MKKTLSILLAVVLMFALAIPVLAAEDPIESLPGQETQTVTATRTEGGVKEIATVYYVTVEWEIESQLTYTLGDTTYNWTPESTEYIPSTEPAKWSGDASVKITVTNKSNADINAKASWAGEQGLTTACDFKGKDSVDIVSAATGTNLTADQKVLKGEEKSETINGTVTVSAGEIATTGATVGTVTLNIDKK